MVDRSDCRGLESEYENAWFCCTAKRWTVLKLAMLMQMLSVQRIEVAKNEHGLAVEIDCYLPRYMEHVIKLLESKLPIYLGPCCSSAMKRSRSAEGICCLTK